MEVDVFTLRDPADAELIDGSIGEGSPFHQTFGYYAHGVTLETAILPSHWRDRVIEVRNANTGGSAGLCLEVHDLASSKIVAGREKDIDFVKGLLRHRLASAETVRQRIAATPLDDTRRRLSLERLNRLSRG